MSIAKGTKHIPWTPEDDARLVFICTRNQSIGVNGTMVIKAAVWREIAALMGNGRTVRSCKDRFWTREARAKLKYKPRAPIDHRAQRIVGRRLPGILPEPASITAFICGDPLPGRSALDEKRREESRA